MVDVSNMVKSLGFSAEEWIAMGTMLLALATFCLTAATVALVIVGRKQIREASEELRKARTLDYCNRFDTDQLLHTAIERLENAQMQKSFDISAHKLDAITVLNYFDALAIGIKQKLYVEDLARDHLWPIVRDQIESYFPGQKSALDPTGSSYGSLSWLLKRWEEQAEKDHSPKFESK